MPDWIPQTFDDVVTAIFSIGVLVGGLYWFWTAKQVFAKLMVIGFCCLLYLTYCGPINIMP